MFHHRHERRVRTSRRSGGRRRTETERDWLDLLEAELTTAGSPYPIRDAFVIDAYLTAANTRRELFGDDSELVRARELAHKLIEAL